MRLQGPTSPAGRAPVRTAPRISTEANSKLLNKELDFSLYPSRLDVKHNRAKFENLYSKLRDLLSTCHKTKACNLNRNMTASKLINILFQNVSLYT